MVVKIAVLFALLALACVGIWRRKSWRVGIRETSDRILLEEGQRLAAQKGVTGTATMTDPKQFDADEFVKMIEEQAKQEDELLERSGHSRITITIPTSILPLGRGARFEDPLAKALGELGRLNGGGSLADEVEGKLVITEVDIGVVVTDLDRALPIIVRCLKAQGAPKSTTISVGGQKGKKYLLEE